MSDQQQVNGLTIASPADLEKAMIEKEQDQLKNGNLSAEDAASATFALYYPYFVNAITSDKLSRKTLCRVILSLVSSPLKDPLVNLKRKEERDLWNLGEKLFQAKTVMVLHTLYQHNKELQDLENSSKLNETEESNGKAVEAPAEVGESSKG
jgi:hypothetical protein